MTRDWTTVRGTLERWRRSRRLRIVGLSTAAYLVGEFVVDPVVLESGLPIDFSVGFVLALGIALGPTVAIGAGVGTVLADVETGTVGLHSVFGYLAAFLLVFVAVTLWNWVGRRGHLDHSVAIFVRFVTASVPALVTWAAVSAWGADMLMRMPFTIAFLDALGEAAGALAIGIVTLPVARRLTALGIPVRPSDSEIVPDVARRWIVIVATVPFLWGMFGTVLSVVLQPLQLESSQRLANRFGWSVVAVVDIVGPAGRQLLTLLGFVGTVLILAAALKIQHP